MQFNLALCVEVLERTPAALRALLRDIDTKLARGTEGPDTFSPFDNIGHLIDGEETDWMPRARIILAQGANRRFEPYDRFRHRARNVTRTLDSLLDEFARLRAENLRVLESWHLTDAQLDLPDRAPEPWRGDPAAAPRGLGGARSGAHRAGRARNGEAVSRRCRAVGALLTCFD